MEQPAIHRAIDIDIAHSKQAENYSFAEPLISTSGDTREAWRKYLVSALSSCVGAAMTIADAAVRVSKAVAKENFMTEEDD